MFFTNNLHIYIVFNTNSWFLAAKHAERLSGVHVLVCGKTLQIDNINLGQFRHFSYLTPSIILLVLLTMLRSLVRAKTTWVLPHQGGRLLRLITKTTKSYLYIDDGFGCLTGIAGLKAENLPVRLITYSDLQKSCVKGNAASYIPAASIDELLSVIPPCKISMNNSKTNILVIVSSNFPNRIWGELEARTEKEDVIVWAILHPQSHKNDLIPPFVRTIPSQAWGVESVILGEVHNFSEIYIGRSFSAITTARILLGVYGSCDQLKVYLTQEGGKVHPGYVAYLSKLNATICVDQ